MTTPSPYPRFTLTTFTTGKKIDRNEDAFGANADTVVLSDGATDKAGGVYEKDKISGEYKTGGEVAASLVVQMALASDVNGQELCQALAMSFRDYYAEHAPQALDDSAYRFAATMVVARIVDDQLVITQVGDTAFRINGKDTYTNDKEVDTINASLRKQYIERTGDIAGGREHIMPRLKQQHSLQNNADDPLGYGVLDGGLVPAKFIHSFSFPLSAVQTLELVTDGYFGAFPDQVSIEAYEALRDHIEATDPHKIGDFASTKTSDDRTVLIIKPT